MDQIVIYGINMQAQALYEMITQEQRANVKAFVVDRAYKKQDELLSMPVYEAERIRELFPPEQFKVCLSFGYKNMVLNREEKFKQCKMLGYEIFTFISEHATVYTKHIGEGCNIYPGTTIMPFVEVGEGCFIEAGCTIAHHTQIGAFNFIAPGAHFCGDVKTGKNCFFGGACEVVNSCEIGELSFVAAGAKVSRNIPAQSVVVPARSMRIEKDPFSFMQKMFKKMAR